MSRCVNISVCNIISVNNVFSIVTFWLSIILFFKFFSFLQFNVRVSVMQIRVNRYSEYAIIASFSFTSNHFLLWNATTRNLRAHLLLMAVGCTLRELRRKDESFKMVLFFVRFYLDESNWSFHSIASRIRLSNRGNLRNQPINW